MDVIILLTVLQMVSFIGAYEFTCPSQAHWRLRAKSTCKPPSNYTCLFDINLQINIYRDRCNRPRILGPGYKYVFQPNLNRAACSGNRYQPFNFKTVGYSDCAYQKSLCNSLGQETYEIGDTTIDRKCICDTNRGYTFITSLAHQCHCNPLTEDCSCYLGITPYNETIGLRDIKCYHEMKMTSSPFLGDMFNISRNINIIEFDNYKYNLKHIPTNEYRIEAAKWVLILLFIYLVVLIIVVGIMRRWIHIRSKDCSIFNKLLKKSQTEKRYFVRIMLVGKESAGKTSLLRRLLKEDISVSSTDGVDIVVRRCKINVLDGKWTIGKAGSEFDDKKERINRALNPNGKTQMSEIECTNRTKFSTKSSQIGKIESNALVNKSIDVNFDSTMDITADELADNRNDTTMQVEPINYSTKNHLDKTSTPTHYNDRKAETKEIQEKNESSLLVMPKDLIDNVFSKSTAKTSRNLYALCALWDFAGQKDFYATHQAFLTSSAVYLVVVDMEKDILSKKDELQCDADFQNIGEYVGFWFDSIHCHRTTDELSSNGHFDPPILLIFTGKDKYNEADFEQRKNELNVQIDTVLGKQSKYHHLHNKFYLSNTNDTDKEFETLRYAIYETARTMNNWGKVFPLKWILLEHLIDINKKEGKHFINFTDMFKLAKHPDIDLRNENELLLFLQFQHHEGNIIFFENIRDLIILNPQWLADAFRCLVSNKFETSKLHHRNDWTLFKQQGKISESLITELFKSKDGIQFSGQESNLHQVMEKLDILVKIEKNDYIMPSMMPSSTFDDVCKKVGIKTGNCKRTSWLCFKFEFLPPSFFNHISAWFIRKYNYTDMDSKSAAFAFYRGICVFNIDESGCEKILVTMSNDIIALQVVLFSEQQEKFESICSEIYNEVKTLIEDIKKRYKVKLSFKLHFKCSDGDYYNDTFAYETLQSKQECFCPQHKKSHRSDLIYLPWMKNEVEKIPDDRAKISRSQDKLITKHEPNKEKFNQDQSSVKYNLPVSVTLRHQFNIKKSKNESLDIYSCIKTGNTLVFTDCHNNRLIICNSDGTDIDHIPLSGKPYCITEIDSNTVAVSCLYDSTILIINISTRSVTSTIKTRGDCEGISYNDNNLYVVIDGSIIHVMDLTGKVIRTIPLPTDRIYNITVDRDRLVCIDIESIYCCSLDGKVMWKFKKDAFQDLTRVRTDDEGNVYVTNGRTHTVIVVSGDGKHHRELLTKSDGLDWPYGIYYDKKENSLLVCNHFDGNAFLFDVIKKLT